MIPIDQVGELLSMLAPEKKISFDKSYAKEVYRQYNESKSVVDSTVVATLKAVFGGNTMVGMVLSENLLKGFLHSVIEVKKRQFRCG
jgi:hypothetical protein